MENNKEYHFKHSMPVQIRFSDVDQFGHVNNSIYFSLYDLAKTDYMNQVLGDNFMHKLKTVPVVANINANFIAPVFFSDNMEIETTAVHLGNKSFTLLQRAVTKDTHIVKCECRTILVCFSIEEQKATDMPDIFREAIIKYEGTMQE